MWATYILGPIFTLLPRGWREKVFQTTPNRLARATTLSGILEALLALVGLVGWYSIYVTLARNALVHSSAGSGGATERMGLFAYIWFWLNPITWIVAYFILEGVLRSVAALSTGESFGTLPLFVAERTYQRATRPPKKPELALVSDEITTGDATCDMKIASCRAKADWKYPLTIRYAEAYFQVVASADRGAGPRPYVYSLRRLPAGEIARGLKQYHPDDVLAAALPVAKIET